MESPIFSRNNIININNNSEDKNFSPINFTKLSIKRKNSDIRLINMKNKSNINPKIKKNFLSFFTFDYDREKYLEINDNNLLSKNKNNIINKKKRVNWKLFYDIVFKDNKYFNNEYNNAFNRTNSTFSEIYNNINLNDEKNKVDSCLEMYRFQIIIDKIKNKMKKKYKYDFDEDVDIEADNKIKKVVKLPEMLSYIKKNEQKLKYLYKVGISETDKNRFIPMLINKLQKRFNIYLDKNKYEKRQLFNSLPKYSYENENSKIERESKKKLNKLKKIKFENTNNIHVNYSINEENNKQDNINNNLKGHNKINTIKGIHKYFSSDKRKSYISNNLLYFKNQRNTLLSLNRKSVFIIEKKSKSDFSLNMDNSAIFFNKNELNNINNKKINLTDDIYENFKSNIKTIINDEILFKEFKKKYPNYDEEIFNLKNNLLLYEKIYDKLEIRNLVQKNKYKDYNHCINNFLSLKNKIILPISEKYEINNEIIENSLNLQNIINYFK